MRTKNHKSKQNFQLNSTMKQVFSPLLMVLAFVFFISTQIFSQTGNVVTGVVTSVDGQVLIGVNVFIKGTTVATITDINGNYSIKAAPADVLQFSYLGFVGQEITVGDQKYISIVMLTENKILNEVVVIGYGQQKKSHLTGAISKVSNEKLDQIPSARLDDALVGQVSGVNIQMTNPAAGEAPTIRIRGQGSISFNSDPLIVVDGIAVGNDADFLSSMDMNSVESVEILKDASSSAIYGSRGANGIIMVTTKQGKDGPTKFSYDTYIGFKSVPHNDALTTSDAWADYVRANNNGELTPVMQYIEKLGTYTDWQKTIMDGGMIQSHSLSATGGSKNTKFRSTLSYLDDEGVLLTDNFKKLNLSLNLDTKVSKNITFGIMINPSYTTQRRFPLGVHDAIRQNPWLPIYLDEHTIQFVNRTRENGRWANAKVGDYAMERMFDDFDLVNGVPNPNNTGTDISSTSNQGSYAKVVERDYRKFQSKVYANTYLKIKLAKGLNFKQTLGGDARFSTNKNWTGIQASRNGAADSGSSLSTSNQFHTVAESTLNYEKESGKHDISAVAGFAYEDWKRDYSSIVGAGYQFDYIQTIPQANLVGGSTTKRAEKLISYLSRINYGYDNKYLFSLSARWDGSSKFGPDNKFGFFPAASIGWRVSQEDFLIDSKIINNLKLRASYGITGSNSGIGEYDHLGLIAPVGTGLQGNNTGFNATNIANSELRWEKLVEFNPGVDVSFISGRLGFSLDYYIRTSKDLLLNLPIPSVTGFETALVNKGEVENKGFELEVYSKNIQTADFTWSTSGNISHNKNTLVNFSGASGLISIIDDKRPAEWVAIEGQPISSFYGYVVKQEIDLQYIKDPFYPINAHSQDIYVKDLNGDGLIDTDDRTVLGSPYPDFVYSLTNNFTYKGFDFSIMFQGSQGAEVRNISPQYINNEFASNMDYTSDFPDKGQVQQRIFTSDQIQDASYFTLRNLNIGYTFNGKLLDKANIRKFRIYVGAQNLLYIMANNYTGFNPEGVDMGGTTAFTNPLTFGYQVGPAPIYKTVNIGLNVNF